MSKIRSKNTGPELKLRKILQGFHFGYQPKGIPGNPDFASRKNRTAIFLDGCFWHGYSIHYRPPKSNGKFWQNKIRANMARDRRNTILLESSGWDVIRLWECDLVKDSFPDMLRDRLHEIRRNAIAN